MTRRHDIDPQPLPASAASAREPVVGRLSVRELKIKIVDGKLVERHVAGFEVQIRPRRRKLQPRVRREAPR